MSVRLPEDFPIHAVMKLLYTIPPDLAKEHQTAVEAIKELCRTEYSKNNVSNSSCRLLEKA